MAKPKWWYTKSEKEKEQIMEKMSIGWGKKPITRVKLVCPTCGRIFEVKKSTINRRKYCNKECFNKSKQGKIPKNIKIAQSKSPFQKGKKNINWKGGIYKYPAEWTGKLKHLVWVRDKNKCQLCGKIGKKRSDLVCHHIDFDKKNCNIENIQLLCRSCHMKLHWQEGR